MTKGIVGRGDLVRFLAGQPHNKQAALAALLGYEFKEEPKEKERNDDAKNDKSASTSSNTLEINDQPLRPTPFWRQEGYEALPENRQGKQQIEQAIKPPLRPKSGARPRYHYLADWASLEPRLRSALAQHQPGQHLDIHKLIEQISRVHIPEHLPHQQRRVWGDNLQIIDDRSFHLAPYLADHAMVQQQLARLFPGTALEIAILDPAFDDPVIHTADGEIHGYRPPGGGRVLILSDLGCLAQDGGRRQQFWQRFGQDLQAEACQATALLPCSPQICSAQLEQHYQLLSWQHPATPWVDEAQREAEIERLLRLLSPALYFQPGLLRAVRLALGAKAPDAAIESLLWQHSAANCYNHTAAAVAGDVAERQISFASEEVVLIKRVLDEMRRWLFQPELPAEIWYEMLWCLPPAAQQLASAEELKAAVEFYAHIAQRSSYGSEQPLTPNARAWVERSTHRLTDSARNKPELKAAIRQLEIAQGHWQSGTVEDESRSEQRLCIYQQGDTLILKQKSRESETPPGSLLTELRSTDGHITLQAQNNQNSVFWKEGKAPKWAERWNWDSHGAWLEFQHKGVCQRMRWIAPGSFWMGSPDNEPGRWEDEGPQHRVSLTQGYWLFDSPVTQALWQAVMDGNPSKFKSPQRPVETVSWEEAKKFIARLNELKPGLALTLPTEAQWEYACRAGSETALYTGDIAILGERNAPALDDIAWYGGNSGVGFEVDNGYDSSAWNEKQYEHERAGTHPVKFKPPNLWGLHDMLGNVWEWCEDGKRDYETTSETDPLGLTEAGAERVFRGGSWSGLARSCRSACRGWALPDYRRDSLGFRCARVQVSQVKEAEPAPKGAIRPAEQGRMRALGRGEAQRVILTGKMAESSLSIPKESPELIISSDQEQLIFCQQTQPSWASAMGRDRFGLWSEFTLETGQRDLVRQRLRWIPPGCFVMGSPESEHGGLAQPDDEGEWFTREGPQHEVTISKGYWLFDSPITQALWQAVMDGNPSEFKSPQRPVETVSWEEAREFIDRINKLKSALALSLPTEAQWEYACCAGSETALYTGEIEILGKNNAPALDDIAWYSGNSGVDFELDNGADSSGWPEKQYEHTRAGTHPVKLKPPNPWGLHDMLGNVWEWCEDAIGDYDATSTTDPLMQGKAGAGRVIRGGSWNVSARSCRSACRSWARPGFRSNGLGFRCARAQE